MLEAAGPLLISPCSVTDIQCGLLLQWDASKGYNMCRDGLCESCHLSLVPAAYFPDRPQSCSAKLLPTLDCTCFLNSSPPPSMHHPSLSCQLLHKSPYENCCSVYRLAMCMHIRSRRLTVHSTSVWRTTFQHVQVFQLVLVQCGKLWQPRARHSTQITTACCMGQHSCFVPPSPLMPIVMWYQ